MLNVECFAGHRGRRGFSLIEVMIVMVLLTVIVLGLLAMFNQTQRAFKTGMAQVDVTATGRAVMDLMVRDLEQMASYPPQSGRDVVNFTAYSLYPNLEPLRQKLPGLNPDGQIQERTNILQTFFFVSRVNQTWTGTGYIVDGGTNGVGSLYSYTTNVTDRNLDYFTGWTNTGLYSLFIQDLNNFANNLTNHFRRLADGVIDLKVLAYAPKYGPNDSVTNGLLVDPQYVYPEPARTNIFAGLIDAWYEPQNAPIPVAIGTVFRSNALPSAVEIELGMVEPEVVEKVRSLPTYTTKTNYLYNQAGKVHLFRQRVYIEAMNPDAYAFR